MNLKLAEQIANAVLYEGYMLYPYRRSAVKNRQRWTFGGVYPPAYSEAQRGTDACSMQTQCLVRGNVATALDVRLRFLQILSREAEGAAPWQEAVEREVGLPDVSLGDLAATPRRHEFSFPAGRETESDGKSGTVVRRQEAISGAVEAAVEQPVEGLFKLTITVLNLTPLEEAGQRSRDDALLRAFVSTHSLLSVRDGEFVSLLEPPDGYATHAAACRNIGTYPVMVGGAGERDMMLSSPIILYDYPEIAGESAGDLFDGTEIDEILSLRILTLTDEEKQEVRESDDRARALLDRTETLPPEVFMRLHGVMRGIGPVREEE